MGPDFRAGRLAFAVVLTSCLVPLGSVALGQPAPRDRMAAYQRALQREQVAADVFKVTGELREQATQAQDAAAAYRSQAVAAADVAERRRRALDEAADGTRAAEAATFDAMGAVARFGQAAVQALAAASAYGSAPPAAERDRARQAYATAADRTAAFDKARASVAEVELRSRVLRSRASWALVVQRDAARTLALVTAQPAVALSIELLRLRRELDTRKATPPALADAIVAFDSDARAAEARSRALVAGLAVPASLEAILARVGDVARTIAPRADTYFDAELRVTAETEADAFAAALRAANQGSCPAGSACQLGLDREVNAVKGSLIVALGAARVGERGITEAIFETSRAGVDLDKAAGLAMVDARAAGALASAAADVATRGATLYAAASAALVDARRAYVDAIAAADAAYLAAFGVARKSTPPPDITTAVTAPAQLSTATAAPAPAPIGVVDHVYELVTLKTLVSRGYGAYTYVLLPLQVTADLARESRDRYQALLTAIVQSTARASTVTVPRERLNLFCIPSLVSAGPVAGQFPVTSYDSSKAKALLATARSGYLQRPDVLKRLGFTAGPFLLTTPTPIEALDPSAPAMFVDLSGYEPRLYATILGAYKTALVQAPPRQDFVQWSPPVHIAIASEMTRISPTVQPIVSFVQSFLSSGGKKAEAATTP